MFLSFHLHRILLLLLLCSIAAGIDGGSVGDGKSGMLFFFSKNRNYVIKTLKKSELKPMLELLPDYYEHMRTHTDSVRIRTKYIYILVTEYFTN